MLRKNAEQITILPHRHFFQEDVNYLCVFFKKLSAFTPLKETKKCLKLVFIYIFPLIAFAVSSSLNCAHFMKIVEFQATWN